MHQEDKDDLLNTEIRPLRRRLLELTARVRHDVNTEDKAIVAELSKLAEIVETIAEEL